MDRLNRMLAGAGGMGGLGAAPGTVGNAILLQSLPWLTLHTSEAMRLTNMSLLTG